MPEAFKGLPDEVRPTHPFFTIHLQGDGSHDDAERIANTAFMAAMKESAHTGWVAAYMTGALPDD